MNEISWKHQTEELNTILSEIKVRDKNGSFIPPDEGFRKWLNLTLTAKEKNQTLFFVGNGASASMASHFSADIKKNAKIQTQVFTDPALITAYANDINYESVFSAPLAEAMKKGDMLIAISSSGESPNIIKAVKTALENEGIVITLSAMKQGNRLFSSEALNFYAPGLSYGLAETAHSAILHYWTDIVLEKIKSNSKQV